MKTTTWKFNVFFEKKLRGRIAIISSQNKFIETNEYRIKGEKLTILLRQEGFLFLIGDSEKNGPWIL